MSETNLSVPASLDIDSGNKNVSQRDAKGYNFEVKVNNVLNDVGITYLSNPLNNIKEWKSRQGKGSDFKIPLWNWEIEAKYSDAKIFPSWIKRDYIPRFSKNSFKLVVHNEAMKLTNGSLELCFLYDIYLVEIGYLKYVLKIEMKHRQEGNKLLEAKNSKQDIKKQNIENQNSEKQKKNSGIEGLEPVSSKSSATFKDKFRTKLRSVFGNLLFKTKMLVLNLFHDTSGRLPRTTEYKTRKWIMSAYGNRSILEYCSDKSKRSKLHPILKTCPYKTVLICKMKYFKPKYICGFPFQNKIRYCDYCKDVPDEEIVDLYGRPICKYYNERCDIILQSYEYVNLENSQICYWISRSERVKVLRELEKYRGENTCPNKH
jgi:hypothetical protein